MSVECSCHDRVNECSSVMCRGIVMRMMCYVVECPWNVRAMIVLTNVRVC